MARGDSRRIDLTGQQFVELKVIRLSDQRDKHSRRLWECECSCGEIVHIPGFALRAGTYQSCGCKRVEKRDRGVREHIKNDQVDDTRRASLKAKPHKDNRSGIKGVDWVESRQTWRAYIGIQGKQITLGYRKNKDDAIALRRAGEEKYHQPYLDS